MQSLDIMLVDARVCLHDNPFNRLVRSHQPGLSEKSRAIAVSMASVGYWDRTMSATGFRLADCTWYTSAEKQQVVDNENAWRKERIKDALEKGHFARLNALHKRFCKIDPETGKDVFIPLTVNEAIILIGGNQRLAVASLLAAETLLGNEPPVDFDHGVPVKINAYSSRQLALQAAIKLNFDAKEVNEMTLVDKIGLMRELDPVNTLRADMFRHMGLVDSEKKSAGDSAQVAFACAWLSQKYDLDFIASMTMDRSKDGYIAPAVLNVKITDNDSPKAMLLFCCPYYLNNYIEVRKDEAAENIKAYYAKFAENGGKPLLTRDDILAWFARITKGGQAAKKAAEQQANPKKEAVTSERLELAASNNTNPLTKKLLESMVNADYDEFKAATADLQKFAQIDANHATLSRSALIGESFANLLQVLVGALSANRLTDGDIGAMIGHFAEPAPVEPAPVEPAPKKQSGKKS